MEIKNWKILVLLSLLMVNCSSPKFYKEVVSTYPKLNDKVTVANENVPIIEVDNQDRSVFIALKKQLKNTNHIIYHFVPSTTLSENDFSTMLYDVDNKKYFYLEKENNGKIDIVSSVSLVNDDYHKFIVDNYLNGNISYIKKLGENSNTSGLQTREAIYDINLMSGKNERFVFKSFLFMEGKPVTNGENSK